jgi:transcriptional regulator with XRE-family HTH domain
MNDTASISAKFGFVLRRHRLRAGLSQRKLADKSKRDFIHLGLIERGLRRASVEVASAHCVSLGTSLSALIIEAEKLRS